MIILIFIELIFVSVCCKICEIVLTGKLWFDFKQQQKRLFSNVQHLNFVCKFNKNGIISIIVYASFRFCVCQFDELLFEWNRKRKTTSNICIKMIFTSVFFRQLTNKFRCDASKSRKKTYRFLYRFAFKETVLCHSACLTAVTVYSHDFKQLSSRFDSSCYIFSS